MAGRHVELTRIGGGCGITERASLREDYLNQVQRDFLSRPRPGKRPAGTTPLANVRILPIQAGLMRTARIITVVTTSAP
jgi:hypothetical protein